MWLLTVTFSPGMKMNTTVQIRCCTLWYCLSVWVRVRASVSQLDHGRTPKHHRQAPRGNRACDRRVSDTARAESWEAKCISRCTRGRRGWARVSDGARRSVAKRGSEQNVILYRTPRRITYAPQSGSWLPMQPVVNRGYRRSLLSGTGSTKDATVSWQLGLWGQCYVIQCIFSPCGFSVGWVLFLPRQSATAFLLTGSPLLLEHHREAWEKTCKSTLGCFCYLKPYTLSYYWY